MAKHKCVDCGYLAVRDLDTRQLEEAERGETGNVVFPNVRKVAYGGAMSPKYDLPICFARASNLQSEYGVRPSDAELYRIWQANIQKVLIQERDCSDFTDWITGFTPREHREMIDRENMLKWQSEREDADKKWRSTQERYLVKVAGTYAIIAGIIGAAIGAVIAWLLTRGGH